MAEAADQAAWKRTFALLAQLHNAFRDEGDDPIDPMLFYPWEEPEPREPAPPTAVEREALKKMFPGKRE